MDDMQDLMASIGSCTIGMSQLYASLRLNRSASWRLGAQTRFCTKVDILAGALRGYQASISFAPGRCGNRCQDHRGANYMPEVCEILLEDPEGEHYYNDDIGYGDVSAFLADEDGPIAQKILNELDRLASLTSADLG
jgi:hypothetical protein